MLGDITQIHYMYTTKIAGNFFIKPDQFINSLTCIYDTHQHIAGRWVVLKWYMLGRCRPWPWCFPSLRMHWRSMMPNFSDNLCFSDSRTIVSKVFLPEDIQIALGVKGFCVVPFEIYTAHGYGSLMLPFFFHYKHWGHLGAVLIKRCHLISIGIPMLKIRRSRGRLIFNMGIPIPGIDGLYTESVPWCF